MKAAASVCWVIRANAMLPRIAVDNLLTAVFEACGLATEGHVADGYQVLLIGKQRALARRKPARSGPRVRKPRTRGRGAFRQVIRRRPPNREAEAARVRLQHQGLWL